MISQAARIAILGSCVSRDVFSFSEDAAVRDTNICYLARTSMASIMTRPLASGTEISLPPLSDWETRAVVEDLAKTAVARLVEYDPTHLIIDFIDDRYDLLSDGPTTCLLSWELYRSGGLDYPGFAGFQIVPRLSQEAYDLWHIGMVAFAALMRRDLPNTTIILHHAPWSNEYVDEHGERLTFSDAWNMWPDKYMSVEAINAVIASYETALMAEIPDTVRISASPDNILAQTGHKWKLSPFHYAGAFYDDVLAEIASLTNANSSELVHE